MPTQDLGPGRPGPAWAPSCPGVPVPSLPMFPSHSVASWGRGTWALPLARATGKVSAHPLVWDPDGRQGLSHWSLVWGSVGGPMASSHLDRTVSRHSGPGRLRSTWARASAPRLGRVGRSSLVSGAAPRRPQSGLRRDTPAERGPGSPGAASRWTQALQCAPHPPRHPHPRIRTPFPRAGSRASPPAGAWGTCSRLRCGLTNSLFLFLSVLLWVTWLSVREM